MRHYETESVVIIPDHKEVDHWTLKTILKQVERFLKKSSSDIYNEVGFRLRVQPLGIFHSRILSLAYLYPHLLTTTPKNGD